MYVNGYKVEVDPVALRRTFVVDETGVRSTQSRFFVKRRRLTSSSASSPPTATSSVPSMQGDPMYLLGCRPAWGGTCSLARSTARAVSMTIGLVGVALSLLLGVLPRRDIRVISAALDRQPDSAYSSSSYRRFPSIPLWMGLAAAIPLTWPPLRVYFLITVILLRRRLDGSGARVVRGRFFALKTEDFVTAAKLDGMQRPCGSSFATWCLRL